MRLYEFATETGKPLSEEQLNEIAWIPLIIGAGRLALYISSLVATGLTALEIYDKVWYQAGARTPEEFLDWWNYDLTDEEREAYKWQAVFAAAGIIVPAGSAFAIGKWANRLKSAGKLDKEIAKKEAELSKLLKKKNATQPKPKQRVEPTVTISKDKIANLQPKDFNVKPKFKIDANGKMTDLKTGRVINLEPGEKVSSGGIILPK